MLTSSISFVMLNGLVPKASSEVPATCTISGSDLLLRCTLLSAARQTATSIVSLVRCLCHVSNLLSKPFSDLGDMPVVRSIALEIACTIRNVRPGDTPSPLLKPSCVSSALRLLTSLDSMFSTKWASLPSSAAQTFLTLSDYLIHISSEHTAFLETHAKWAEQDMPSAC